MIYLVTVLTEIDHCVIMSSKGKDRGYDARTVGWFENFEDANTNVKLNCGDIHEGKFCYALIEEVAEGIYSAAYANKTWYEWHDVFREYQRIEEPPQWHNIYAIGIG